MITVKIEMTPVSAIIDRMGLTPDGDAQMFLTKTINRRITRYMPYRTGALSTKLKRIKSPTEVVVDANYAQYQYYGKVMVGKAPKIATDKPLNQQPHAPGNDRAGPFWDRYLMAFEGDQIAEDLKEYITGRTNA